MAAAVDPGLFSSSASMRFNTWATFPKAASNVLATRRASAVCSGTSGNISGWSMFRIYGVVGRLDALRPELRLRVGVYGHFAPLEWPQVFCGPEPGVLLMSEHDTPNE